jgi:3-oxoacyl-[acyl-carrier protein] reductase
MRLEGKIALVTGGGRSIGRAIALGFGREGADVAVNYERHGQAAEEVAAAIREMGRQAFAVQADVSDAAQVQAMVEQTLATFGRIDILMNNAGAVIRKPFLEIEEETWDRIIDVNLKGVFLVSQVVARHMARQGGGCIINTSSISAKIAYDDLSHYQAAKAGVYMLTRGMAYELAKHNIRVNAIEPGLIETDLNRARLADPDLRARRVGKIPLGRPGQPDDLAGAAIYLASDESAFTTGAAIRIDGGQTTW